MRILYITQFYKPESVAASFRSTEQAKVWSDSGNEVTVFTSFPNYPFGKIFDGYKAQRMTIEDCDNLKVIRNYTSFLPNTGTIFKVINSLSFIFVGIFNLIFSKKRIGKEFDIIVVTIGPVFCGILGLFAKRIFRKKLIVEFRDITSKQLIATGKKESDFSVKVIKKIEERFSRKADRIVVVSEGFINDIKENFSVPGSKISYFPNGVDTKNIDFKREFENNTYSFGYFGALGISQNLLGIVDELANTLMELGKKIELVGEGVQKKELREVEERFKDVIVMEDGMNQNELEDHYSDIDFSFVVLKNDVNFSTTIPSKIFQSLSRGVPVLFLGPEGTASSIISENECGICVQSLHELKIKLTDFYRNKEYKKELQRMGISGRKLVDTQFNRVQISNDYYKMMVELYDI